MKTLEAELRSCEIEVRAGPDGENSDVYAWINSRIPDWAKSANDPAYMIYTANALKTAKKIVRETGQDITLKLKVDYRPSFL